ncbi:MAG: FAD-dependent oxidoreductase [Streptosporangiales bacterium]|nr:FAD-dependent oxidoreductase [Streptosporangiales bacterium]
MAAGGGPDVLVIGAGVIGLTTGIRLAEAGLDVLIRSAVPPGETTSALASALIGPTFAAPGDPMRSWEQATVAELTAAPRSVPGVRLCRGLLAARPAGMMPPWPDQIAGFTPAAADELPEGFRTGFWATLPVADMPVYLDHLTERFRAAGGEIELRPVESLAEAARQAPRIANCAGLAARELAADPEVCPVRGPKVIVENPGIDTFFIEAPIGASWSAYFPHGDHVVLGGTAREGDENTDPDEQEAAELVRRCVEVEPRLRNARVLDHRVGLRPGRPSVRLEAERIDGTLCVHNYGHGGLGVTTAWGCARDAAALITG